MREMDEPDNRLVPTENKRKRGQPATIGKKEFWEYTGYSPLWLRMTRKGLHWKTAGKSYNEWKQGKRKLGGPTSLESCFNTNDYLYQ